MRFSTKLPEPDPTQWTTEACACKKQSVWYCNTKSALKRRAGVKMREFSEKQKSLLYFYLHIKQLLSHGREQI